MKIEVAVGMPRFRLTFFLFLIFVFSILSPKVWAEEAAVPHYLNFQSVLRDDGGNLITDSFIDLEFRIVDAEGQELYHELQPGAQVIRGVTNVMIGEGLIPGSDPARPTGGLPPEAMDPASGQKFLEVKIGDNRPSDPIELGTVPYAAWSENALHVAPDSIGSEQIKNGSIKLEDLEPGLSFSNLSGQISSSQIPTTVATDDEVNAGIQTLSSLVGQEAANRSTADSSESAARASADSAEASVRAAADTTLQNQITAHQGATSAHGTTGAIVGTTDTQTLSNKTLEGPNFHGATLSGDLILDHARCQSELGHRCLLDGIDLSSLANGEVSLSRLDADVATQAELDGEVSARTAAEDQVQQQLATEAATRAGEDQSLEGSVNTTNANLTGHINQTVAHGSNGDVVGLNTLNSSIATHSATPLGTAHPNGTFPIARLDTDIATQAELDGEASVRLTTDNGLQGQINTTNTNFTNHLNADIATAHPTGRFPIVRLDTDIATQAELDGEAASRISADAGLQSSIEGDLATEAATRASADLDLEAAVGNRVRGTGDTMIGDLYFDQSQCLGRLGRRCRVDGVEVGAEVARLTSIAAGLDDINNIPGVLFEGKIDPSLARDSEFQSADAALENEIVAEAGARASADLDLEAAVGNRVRGTGDTMIGDLYFDQSQCLGRFGRHCQVDGVDIATEVARLESIVAGLNDINNIPGVLSSGKIDDTIARDSELPPPVDVTITPAESAATNPFAFGTMRFSGTGAGTVTNVYNIDPSRLESVSSGSCGSLSMTGRRVFFPLSATRPVDSNYVVLVTGVGISGLGNPPAAYVLAKASDHFDLCVPSNLQQADFVVFRP